MNGNELNQVLIVNNAASSNDRLCAVVKFCTILPQIILSYNCNSRKIE